MMAIMAKFNLKIFIHSFLIVSIEKVTSVMPAAWIKLWEGQTFSRLHSFSFEVENPTLFSPVIMTTQSSSRQKRIIEKVFSILSQYVHTKSCKNITKKTSTCTFACTLIATTAWSKISSIFFDTANHKKNWATKTVFESWCIHTQHAVMHHLSLKMKFIASQI